MIRKSGNRFSSKIMRHLRKLERNRFNLKRLRSRREPAWRICARPALASLLLGSALLCGAASVALAAEGQVSGASVAIFFAQVGVLLLVGRALGELMQRFGQPAVMGQLLGGLLLGPSVLGLIWPAPAARAVSADGRAEKHDRCGIAARHPDAAAAHRHGNRPPAGAPGRPLGDGGRRRRRGAALHLRLRARRAAAGFAAAACRRRASSPPCSSAPRCRSPRSRSWRWSCAR